MTSADSSQPAQLSDPKTSKPAKSSSFRRRLVGGLKTKKEEKRDDVGYSNSFASSSGNSSAAPPDPVLTPMQLPLPNGNDGLNVLPVPVAPQSADTAQSVPTKLEDSRTDRKMTGRRSRSAVRRKGSDSDHRRNASPQSQSQQHSVDANGRDDTSASTASSSRKSGKKRRGEGIVKRIRSLSRSRSRSASRRRKAQQDELDRAMRSDTIVTVTSCRSDGYYNQKAPGSTSKLPRKAPSNLKLFHELAVGIKDAYAAVGQTPEKPSAADESENPESDEFRARMVLWEFIGNIDFLLALVDEVAVDTATRGALKDDLKFKGLRDVIKKCNKVLEEMLVRRERRYTLFFRLVKPGDTRDIDRIRSWNDKVEKAVGAVTEGEHTDFDTESDSSSITDSSTSSKSVFKRGRQLLPVAGRVRARRATPTPRLRNKQSEMAQESSHSQSSSSQASQPQTNAAEDGFSAVTSPVTTGNLAALQKSLGANGEQQSGPVPSGLVVSAADVGSQKQALAPVAPVQPKDELVDVIRGLRMEKMKNREGMPESDLAALKPDWRPKAEIPMSVPKLPTEYIHRHRLMKQVVSCLVEPNGAAPRENEEKTATEMITSITSRHGDKAGNGKTTLAVAAIQTVEVRERFPDGIAWLQLGRDPLTEKDTRRLYEELYRQLIIKESDLDIDLDDRSTVTPKGSGSLGEATSRESSFEGITTAERNAKNESSKQRIAQLVESRRRFQGGDIEGIKENLGRLFSNKKVLIVLDDVWRVEDAKWFIFDNQLLNGTRKVQRGANAGDPHPCRMLITTRTPSLLGPGLVQEVFVRILSEHEAVKLLLSTSGRRPYGGKNSAVFNQAKLIVKGCGNSPLAVRLAGSMLRQSSRSWNISSPAWSSLIHQCRLNLEEASQLRSFVNAVNRVVDLSFFTVSDVQTRVALRRCFVAFAMAFRENDWMLSGKGIPQSVVLRMFKTIISTDRGVSKEPSATLILSLLEKLKLVDRARHGCSARSALRYHASDQRDGSERSESDWDDADEPMRHHGNQQLFLMHDSLKAVAEEMSQRRTATLSPDSDGFTSYLQKIEEEKDFNKESGSVWTAPFRFLAQQFSPDPKTLPNLLQDDGAHKLLVTSLIGVGENASANGTIAEVLKTGQLDVLVIPGGEKMEEFIAACLPFHLMRCQAYNSAAEILSDTHYIARRVSALGIVEATSRHVTDLQELRRLAGGTAVGGRKSSVNAATPKKGVPASPRNPISPGDSVSFDEQKLDVGSIVRESSRLLIEEVYRVANKTEGSTDSLGMAMCLAAAGDGLLKARQPRDAMIRLEEAIDIYRGLLGPYHTNVADVLHSVAKALVKLGETRIALLKFAEAARIYEACDATLHFNSIANAQSLASLLVDLEDLDKAQSMFEEVIAMRKTVYGEFCVPVAKTINAYAILLAKLSRMDVALQNYEAAKETYMKVPKQLIYDPEFEIKCKYDVTLINLNIASIRSKKGDLKGAVACYEDGVRGLREFEAAQAELQKENKITDNGKNTAHKHLVAALGRIGSLKLKMSDNDGALMAYMTLLKEVKEDSPSASQTEKAKAHIKCATIYRQKDDASSHSQSISHLREALEMYTSIFGPDHKDTLAIASSLKQWLSAERKE